MQLDPSAVRAGVRLVALETVGSTNTEARGRARDGVAGPLWVTAQAQTQGRGRGGRSWHSPPGNLFASLLLSDPSPIERAPELAFVAALAVRDAIAAEAPTLVPLLSLKWPNDLLLAGAKCAGILIEGEVEARNVVSVVIGFGVNCVDRPAAALPLPPDVEPAGLHTTPGGAAILYPATDLRAYGAAVSAAQLFARLSATMVLRVAQWGRGTGFAAILDDWRASAHGIGQPIRVRSGGGDLTGRFVDLDTNGRLVLELPGGSREKVSAGDVFPFTGDADRRLPRVQAD